MPKGQSKAERVSRWQSLLNHEAELVAEMPHLAADLATLRELEKESRLLFARLSFLRGEMRKEVLRLREMTRSGDLLRTRLGAGVRGHLGFENPVLLKYGLKPRARRGPVSLPPEPERRLGSPPAAGEPPAGDEPAGSE